MARARWSLLESIGVITRDRGAGPVGTGVAKLLAERGERVRLITRRGSGPDHPAIERVAADATQADRLSELVTGYALYNCANPLYHRWLTDWPPLAAALLTAAQRSGAVLAVASNLYGYGPVETADNGRDATCGDTSEAAAARGHVARGPVPSPGWPHPCHRDPLQRLHRSQLHLEPGAAQAILAGKRAFVPGALDVPHSWTAISDAARTLVTVAAEERAWGRAWLVPSNSPTVRALANQFASLFGAPAPKLSSIIPYPVLWAAGLFVPLVRELRATRYQFVSPFVIDASLTETTFGLAPSDSAVALKAVSAA